MYELGRSLVVVDLQQAGDVAGEVPCILECSRQLPVCLGARRERRDPLDRLAGAVEGVLEHGQHLERVLIQLVGLGCDALQAGERAREVSPQPVQRCGVLLPGGPRVRHRHVG